jgi:hypothetical protein
VNEPARSWSTSRRCWSWHDGQRLTVVEAEGLWEPGPERIEGLKAAQLIDAKSRILVSGWETYYMAPRLVVRASSVSWPSEPRPLGLAATLDDSRDGKPGTLHCALHFSHALARHQRPGLVVPAQARAR